SHARDNADREHMTGGEPCLRLEQLERHIEFGRQKRKGTVEVFWSHTDDGEGPAIDAHLSADDRCARAKAARPVRVAQDGNGLRAAELAVRRENQPSRRWIESECGKVVT